jgi:hypothetical protein
MVLELKDDNGNVLSTWACPENPRDIDYTLDSALAWLEATLHLELITTPTG